MQRKNIQGYSAQRPEGAGPNGVHTLNKMPQIPANVFRSVLCAAGLLVLGKRLEVGHVTLQYPVLE